MKNLTSLLARISASLHSDSLFKQTVIHVVKETTGGELSEEAIRLKDGVLTIAASPILKNEIKLKEERIIAQIKELSGQAIQRVQYL